jgi:hypothetical protein
MAGQFTEALKQIHSEAYLVERGGGYIVRRPLTSEDRPSSLDFVTLSTGWKDTPEGAIASARSNPRWMKMSEALYKVDDAVQWASQGYWASPAHLHTGVVIEVVAAGAVPTTHGDWSFSPRKHTTYVVRDDRNNKTFWPRREWIRPAIAPTT